MELMILMYLMLLMKVDPAAHRYFTHTVN